MNDSYHPEIRHDFEKANDSAIIKTTKRRVKKMQKRQYTAEYKAKIVLEILREEYTVSEIASREEISAKQLHNWKKEFIENAAKVFSSGKAAKEANREAAAQHEEKEALEKKVGQLTIENDWLKKKSSQLLGTDWEQKSGFKR